MASVTAQNLLNAAAQTAGFLESGESLSAQESADALYLLNDLLESYNLQSLMIYSHVNQTFNATANTATYTIGPSQTWNATRPIGIRSGYSTISGIDYPLLFIGDAEYNQISFKTLTGAWPQVAVFDAAFPNATVTLYPVPAQNMTVTLNMDVQLTAVPSLATTIDLPPGYSRLLRYALADEMVTNWNIPASQNTANIRKIKDETMGQIKIANMQDDVLNFDPSWSTGAIPYNYNGRVI